MTKRKKKRRPTVTAVSHKTNGADIVHPTTKKQKTAEKFRIEYAYVIKDLRTIFILASFMFALLIILNLILR